ncbi:putative spermidine synthase [Trypanosoma cruzi]|uniref:Spermidine synthase, putative n=2 Tax=Trypanosoma cruzi TaxID=5693 RepID=Q4DA73_TRYCC|nr:spermidine synthase, putative [Trypanosoma cruzi]EAN89421.1 spermidine synthase, putative [Trypanosoma cruzi]PWV12406.1 putative spermidine synthase [Trypanosoma cruzi]|eukprot:XP_811272.1 spermidine synthase [Trypanosoma cruzi strain CL Brener]
MPGSELISGGWFREENDQWPGQAMSLRVEKVLYDAPTKFQHLTIFESDPKGPWGTVMALDGCIQVTDYDEFVYHEVLGHTSLCSHPKPERVLIIGGGDGGVLREVLRHGTVEHCDLVDIDGEVMEQSKQHFPQISRSLADPRATVRVGDGLAFVRQTPDNTYDVVIIDTTDPAGPASKLFGEAFYKDVLRILKPDGICCNQGESIWLDLELIEKMSRFIRETGFASVQYALMHVPTYPCGSIGTLVCSKKAGVDVTKPLRPVEDMPFAKDLKYYDSEMHKASFALPRFARHINNSE